MAAWTFCHSVTNTMMHPITSAARRLPLAVEDSILNPTVSIKMRDIIYARRFLTKQQFPIFGKRCSEWKMKSGLCEHIDSELKEIQILIIRYVCRLALMVDHTPHAPEDYGIIEVETVSRISGMMGGDQKRSSLGSPRNPHPQYGGSLPKKVST